MKRTMLKLELKKAFHNKFFYLSIAIGILITLLSFVYNVNVYMRDISRMRESVQDLGVIVDQHEEIYTVFNSWIGGEPYSLGTSIYFFIFPLLAALPYGWSYSEERENGYRRMMIVQSGKKSYYLAKYIAVFLSGGVAMVLPLIVNFLMILLVIPARVPDVTASMYYAVFGNCFASELYYTVPFLYVLLYLIIDFLYCGLLACMSYSIAGIIRQKWVTVIVPFLVLLFVHGSTKFIYKDAKTIYKELSPLYFLRGVNVRYSLSGSVMLVFGICLLIVTIIGVVREYRHEIY